MRFALYSWLTCAILLLDQSAKSQDLPFYRSNFGISAGVNLAIGTHYCRAGLNASAFYSAGQFQLNLESRAYISFRAPGPKGTYPEFVLSPGLTYGYGNADRFSNPFLGCTGNQTGYANYFAYAYNLYFNRKGTTQQTGIIAIGVGPVALLTENDILARPSLDRFRTAAFLLQYTHENRFSAGISCILWTGQMGHKVRTEDSRFPNNCYMDTAGGRHTNISCGLLSAQVKYDLGLGQTGQANLGVDAEQVRNAIQNKLIHDFAFLPRKWRSRKNCHLPMLDEHDQPFLYHEDQRIRKPKPFLNVYTNPATFY